MSENSLEVAELRVDFGKVRALAGLSVKFSSGVCGVLGPNGAGKTTLFRVITGSLAPSAGRVSVNGHVCNRRKEVAAHQRTIGYLPQEPGWFDGFSTIQLCLYMAGLRGVKRRLRRERSEAALDSVGLLELAQARLGELSGGQRRRAFIAQALVHQPQTLILDEPTTGLDPVQRIQLRTLIAELGRHRTILLSTHLVEDVAQIASKVIILDTGHLVWSGTPSELAQRGASAPGPGLSNHEQGFLDALNRNPE